MRDALTLRQISQHISGEIFKARTDFLLRQTSFWQEFNEKGIESTVFARPETLDVTGSRVEFFIRPAKRCFLDFLIPRFWRKQKEMFRFNLSEKADKRAIRVMIALQLGSGNELKTNIETDPETGLKPEEIHVAGIT